MEKYLANIAIRTLLMINTTKFPSELSHHDQFFELSHRKLADDRRYDCDFIDAEFSSWGGISTLFLKWTRSTNAIIFYHYYAHF